MKTYFRTVTCIAIDDEPLALALIGRYIRQLPQLRLIDTFEDALKGAEYMQEHPVDLLFIDINMPDISGLDVIRLLKIKPHVILTTAFKNYPLGDTAEQVKGWLVKPISYHKFSASVMQLLAGKDQFESSDHAER